MSRRRFFVEEFKNGQAVVRGSHAHHLYQVLRAGPGQLFELSDTKRVYLARVTHAQTSGVSFQLEEELPQKLVLPEVWLLAAIFKFDRFEWMLEKATELGAAQVVPVVTERTDVGLTRAAPKRVERWRRIGWEAAQQSRRLAPPTVADPLPLREVTRLPIAGARWILDETLAGQPTGHLLATGSDFAMLVGPEGGFTEAEKRSAAEGGFEPVPMGPLILRAETAAIAALSVLMYSQAVHQKSV